MMKNSNDDNKRYYDVRKVVEKRGPYRPLCFHLNGKTVKYDYDIDEYCQLLIDEAKYVNMPESKTELLSRMAVVMLDLSDEDDKAGEDEDNGDKGAVKRFNENLRQKINRLNARLLSGKEKIEADGKKKSSVASDKTCYDYLQKLEKVYPEKSFLTPINDEEPFYYENKYIYSLVYQLIEIMYASEFYNYVPNSKNFQCQCFNNHLKMIEDNIESIFMENEDLLIKWKEIICPMQEWIYNSNYPGFHEGDIWLRKCNELRYFDCSYLVAKELVRKDFLLYQKICAGLSFDLGNTEEEVIAELEKGRSFIKRYEKNEKTVFCNKIIDTLKIIMQEEFRITV